MLEFIHLTHLLLGTFWTGARKSHSRIILRFSRNDGWITAVSSEETYHTGGFNLLTHTPFSSPFTYYTLQHTWRKYDPGRFKPFVSWLHHNHACDLFPDVSGKWNRRCSGLSGGFPFSLTHIHTETWVLITQREASYKGQLHWLTGGRGSCHLS